jgi:hypothetical protein
MNSENTKDAFDRIRPSFSPALPRSSWARYERAALLINASQTP